MAPCSPRAWQIPGITRASSLSWFGYREIDYDENRCQDYASVLWEGEDLHEAWRSYRDRGGYQDGMREGNLRDVRYLKLTKRQLLGHE